MGKKPLFYPAAAGLLLAGILVAVSATNVGADDAQESKRQRQAGETDGVAIERQGLADLQANLAKTIDSGAP